MRGKASTGLAVAALAAAALLVACTSVGERTQLSVGYYSIRGNSFAELDQQIALHGPTVSGVGRALAATNVRMLPDFRFASDGGACRVSHARVSVKAHVTLPRLDSQQKLRQELSRAWTNLEQYARLHEAVHVAIADGYAVKAEEQVMAQQPQPDCSTLRDNTVVLFRRLMADHERDQLRFDEQEQRRIAALVALTRARDQARANQ